MSRDDRLTRRVFLKTESAFAAGAMSMTAKSYARGRGANERFNLGIIGCGHIANTEHVKTLLPMHVKREVGILSVCDVHKTRASALQSRLKEAGAEPRAFTDHRDVLAVPA